MAWIVREHHKDGHIGEFGEFSTKAAADDFAVHAQMPNAGEFVERVDIVEVAEEMTSIHSENEVLRAAVEYADKVFESLGYTENTVVRLTLKEAMNSGDAR